MDIRCDDQRRGMATLLRAAPALTGYDLRITPSATKDANPAWQQRPCSKLGLIHAHTWAAARLP